MGFRVNLEENKCLPRSLADTYQPKFHLYDYKSLWSITNFHYRRVNRVQKDDIPSTPTVTSSFALLFPFVSNFGGNRGGGGIGTENFAAISIICQVKIVADKWVTLLAVFGFDCEAKILAFPSLGKDKWFLRGGMIW